jgi:hypothetical protein
VKEVEEIGNRGAKALDRGAVEGLYGPDHLSFLAGTAGARLEETAERELIRTVLVDVRNAQFGFPEEGMVGAAKDLSLLRDGPYDCLKRRALVDVAETVRFNLGDHCRDPPSD